MKEIPVILFGIGGVGQALVRQIIASRAVVAERSDMAIQVVGMADSRSWLFDAAGLSDAHLMAALDAKAARSPLSDVARPMPEAVIKEAQAAGVEGAILVDMTAVDGMEPVLDAALEAGYGVVLANKKAMAGPWETAQKYYTHPRVRYESTVGGGQPVVATMRYLMDINDTAYAVEGQLSGTLGYICQQLDEGVLFSQAVAGAKALGYTEPDPREDLGGEDVMRKVLIMGRMAGWPLEAGDIEVESLYDASMADLSVDEFMAAVSQLDVPIATRISEASAAGNVLRYVGTVTAEGGTVGLTPIAKSSPLANLKYIKYETALYSDEPMLITGKGAGVEMTAGGVLGDIIALGREG